jgi:hypothetical protein
MSNGLIPASASVIGINAVLKHPVIIFAAVFWIMFHGFVIHNGIS